MNVSTSTFAKLWISRLLPDSLTLHRQEHSLRPYIPQLISRLAHHKRYELLFEYTYLTAAKDFYTEESSKKAQELDPNGYLKYVSERSSEEEKRSAEVLPKSIADKVDDTVWRSLLVGKLEWLIYHSGCSSRLCL